MPKQKGAVPMIGSSSGLTYYRHKHYGDLVRATGRVSRKELKTGDNYAVARLNNEEFGRASTHGKTLRRAFNLLVQYCYDGRMNTNLVSRLKGLIIHDTVSAYGKRDLNGDNLASFRHFELDQDCLASVFFDLPIETKTRGKQMDIFSGITLTKKPIGVAAWKLVSVAASIDFAGKSFWVDEKSSDLFLFEKGEYGIGFQHSIDQGKFVFHGMGIVFYEYDPVIDDYKSVKAEHVNAGFIRYVS